MYDELIRILDQIRCCASEARKKTRVNSPAYPHLNDACSLTAKATDIALKLPQNTAVSKELRDAE